MSHIISNNVGAVSNTVYLKYGLYAYGIPQNSGSQGGSSQTLTSGQQYNLQNNLYVLNGNNVWYSMAFRLNAANENVDLSMYTDYTFSFSYCSNINYFIPSSNDNFRMTNYYEFDADVKSIITDFRDSTNSSLNFYDVKRCRNVIMYGKVKENLNYNAFQLGTTINGSFTRIFGIMPFEYEPAFYNLIISSPTVVFYDNPNEAEEALEKEKQETQAAADASADAGDSSSSDAEQGTASLISAIGSAVSVISSASPTNCKINGNMGNLDVGQIDLCANPVPSFIQVIGSLILILITVPLCITLFNRFIALFRSFQG